VVWERCESISCFTINLAGQKGYNLSAAYMLPRQSDSLELSEVLNQNGDLDRPVDGKLWQVPKRIELRDDRIYWDNYPGTPKGPSARMLRPSEF
jgi:hypothetical protein